MWNLKRNDIDELTQNKKRLTDLENKLMVARGEGIVREFGMDMYTLLYLKWITSEAHATLLHVMCHPGWEGFCRRMGMCG